MYIDQFLDRHPKIKLSQTSLMLCKIGERKMINSIDPLHDKHHIGRLLKNLSAFLKYYPNHKKINFEVLLLSICWHDTWKAKRQTMNPFKLVYYQVYEGIGSMIIFSKNTINLLPQSIIEKVNYTIRKHSQFQFFSLTTLESKILKDIDDLDILNAKRLRPLLRKRKEISIFTKTFGKYYISHKSSEKSLNDMEFSWSKKKAERINKIINKILLLV